MSANGLDSWENWDSLPEVIREYLDGAPYQWSLGAIKAKVRMGWSPEDIVQQLSATDINRKAAAYAERGFEVNPETGEPLGSAP